jgi:GH15 family glucan-1,4-alpha-glucosidase
MRDGFLERYKTHQTDDGLPPGEGVFLPCSFWLADAYILSGRIDDARNLVERLLKVANDLGLFSEEYDPAEKRLIGNFPQALSHVAMASTALLLSRSDSPVMPEGIFSSKDSAITP